MSLYRLVSSGDRQPHAVRSQPAPAAPAAAPLLIIAPVAGRIAEGTAQTTSGTPELTPPGYTPPGTLPPRGGSGYY